MEPIHALSHRLPTAAEHLALAASVGWLDHFDAPTLADSLAGSLHGVVIESSGSVVAMGRVVGDGSHYFYLQDVIVHPAHSDDGLGSRVVSELLDWIRSAAAPRAFVGLFSSPEATDLYSEFGFEEPSDMTGMRLRD
ncbi:GNAT family N-acetyltransferase [Glaciihabitans arcticus]|uniref:GNAT family N-acetyltransferase n=1 Tax=Glaciihabitans arcticus TaxID=2668039 RepID=A0A4Q9GP91_9MICO|nr:GNAT family N-acetyltransferase [Glaciihabitans arcticus]TBN56642.1 GNAT family N-acetyltransferase [Glaciihabitans arcticus]